MPIAPDEIARRVERFRRAARDAGIKLTPQRLEIFRLVAGRADHPSAELVHRALQRRLPTVSLDTVYRTLWLLGDLGLVSTLGPRHGSVRFDANLAPHHHHVCVRCGLTTDFASPALDGLRLPRSVHALGSVIAAHVEVRGLCHRCQNGQDAGPGTRSTPRTSTKRRAR